MMMLTNTHKLTIFKLMISLLSVKVFSIIKLKIAKSNNQTKCIKEITRINLLKLIITIRILTVHYYLIISQVYHLILISFNCQLAIKYKKKNNNKNKKRNKSVNNKQKKLKCSKLLKK